SARPDAFLLRRGGFHRRRRGRRAVADVQRRRHGRERRRSAAGVGAVAGGSRGAGRGGVGAVGVFAPGAGRVRGAVAGEQRRIGGRRMTDAPKLPRGSALLFWGTAATVIVVDQLTKFLAERYLVRY